jgi:hypothetical protein
MIAGILVAALITALSTSAAVVFEAACRRTQQLARTVVFNSAFAVLMGIWARVLLPIADAEGAFIQRHVGIAPPFTVSCTRSLRCFRT